MNFDVGYNIRLLIRTHRPKDNLAISPVYSWLPIILTQLLISPGYCEHIIWSHIANGQGWLSRLIRDHLHKDSISTRNLPSWDSFSTTSPIIMVCSIDGNFLFSLRYFWDILPYLFFQGSCRDLLTRHSILQLYKGRSPITKGTLNSLCLTLAYFLRALHFYFA